MCLYVGLPIHMLRACSDAAEKQFSWILLACSQLMHTVETYQDNYKYQSQCGFLLAFDKAVRLPQWISSNLVSNAVCLFFSCLQVHVNCVSVVRSSSLPVTKQPNVTADGHNGAVSVSMECIHQLRSSSVMARNSLGSDLQDFISCTRKRWGEERQW